MTAAGLGKSCPLANAMAAAVVWSNVVGGGGAAAASVGVAERGLGQWIFRLRSKVQTW